MKPLIAVVAAVVAVAAAVTGVVLVRRADAGPDPYAGAYPLITPPPTASPGPSWRPAGRPAGPLPVFAGRGSRVTGRRITDRHAGLSYPLLASPWHRLTVVSGGYTAGEEIDSKARDYKHSWYVAVYSGPLQPKFDVPGPDHLRAAAELVGTDFQHLLYDDGGHRKEIAGARKTIDGHSAWVTAFRMTHPPGTGRVLTSQTEVVVAVDTGGGRTGVVEITVPNNKNALLPDVNTVIRALRVVR